MTATGISLRGGVVTADALHLSARPRARRPRSGHDRRERRQRPGLGGLDDALLPAAGNSVTVPGVGTLTVRNGSPRAAAATPAPRSTA